MTTTNGHTNGPPRPIAPTMKEVDVRPELRKQMAAALMEGKYLKARRIAESLLLWDDFGGSDLFDRVRPSSNDSSDATRWVPLSVPSDRRHGSRWPVFRTHIELDEFRQQSRLRLATNSYAKGLLRNLANNVIGKGFSYTVTPIVKKGDKAKKGEETTEALDEQTGLVDKVQKVLDDFLRLNNWNGGTHPSTDGVVVTTREREIFRRVKGEDGECFLRFHLDNNGTTLIRIIEPEQVRDMGGLPEDGWSFGIQHQMSPYEDIERPLKYRVFWPDPSATGGEGDNGDTYEDIDADQVLHIKGPDTPSTVKRGLSEFLFDVGRALDRASKLQRNASLGAAFRAATGEIWQHSVGTQQQIQDLAAGLGEQQTASDGTTETVERVRPPMIRRIPKSQELVPLPADQSESYLAAGQGDLRMAASAFCAPEFWMAETSSGNYSNLESAAAPAVRDGQAEQEYYKAAYARVAWKALLWAAECGRLPRGFEEKVKIEVEAPAVLHQNELEDAQVKSIEAQNGVLSPQTWCAETGRDYDIESANMQAHQAQFGMPGMGLDPNDPEGGGGQGGPPGGPGKPPGANGKPQPGTPWAKMSTASQMPERRMFESDEGGKGNWVTLDNGVHVFIGAGGKIEKGPAALTDRKLSDLPSTHKVVAIHGDKHPETGDKAGPKAGDKAGDKAAPKPSEEPTAPESHTTINASGAQTHVVTNPSADGLKNWLKANGVDAQGNSRDGKQLKGYIWKGNIHVWDALDDSGVDVAHDDVHGGMGHLKQGYLSTEDRFEIRMRNGKPVLSTSSGVDKSPAIKSAASRMGILAESRMRESSEGDEAE